MNKQEYENAMAESYGRGYGENEINNRTVLRDGYIASLENTVEKLEKMVVYLDKKLDIAYDLIDPSYSARALYHERVGILNSETKTCSAGD